MSDISNNSFQTEPVIGFYLKEVLSSYCEVVVYKIFLYLEEL